MPQSQNQQIYNKIDQLLLWSYILLISIGWLVIYSAGYNPEHSNIFDFSQTYGKQFVWLCVSLIFGFMILNSSSKIFSVLSHWYYLITIVLLILVFPLAREVNGAKSWIDLGFFRLQPSEFAKFTTALALAYFISEIDGTLSDRKNLYKSILIIIVPFILVVLQGDMGSGLVFLSFSFLLNRFGMPNWIMILGFYVLTVSVLSLLFSPLYIFIFSVIISCIFIFINRSSKQLTQYLMFSLIFAVITTAYSFSIDKVISKLAPHQQKRIMVMVGKGHKRDMWNIRQSQIALGSGQFFGKGYLNGTQSKGNFLPAKETDFIFCTIGEEFGFLGCVLVMGLLVFIIMRILYLSERQKSKFTKVYGYAIVCVLMIHFLINIGMTLGLAPVIGIPLPGLSYGGSSLITFSVMIFAFIRMDSEKWIYN